MKSRLALGPHVGSVLALLVVAAAAETTPARAENRAESRAEEKPLPAEDLEHDHELGGDFIEVVVDGGNAFVTQFTHYDTLAILGGTAAFSAALSWRELEVQNRLESFAFLGEHGRTATDVAGTVLNFPVVSIGAYAWGRFSGDERLIHFATELATAQLVTGLEVIALSYIPYFHSRPAIIRGELEPDEQSFFDGSFRGASAYPSGHVVGLSVLAIKGWEWYGWKLGAPVAAASLITGWARVEEGKHFVADVLTTYALAGVASIAISRTRDAPAQAAFRGNLLESSDGETESRIVLTPSLEPGGAGFTLGGVF